MRKVLDSTFAMDGLTTTHLKEVLQKGLTTSHLQQALASSPANNQGGSSAGGSGKSGGAGSKG